MRVILLGPPGSGKGTQARLLSQRLGLAHIATGDILREAVRTGTPMGQRAIPYMEQGRYVPDEIVNAIIAERFARADRPESFVMDGYPRTLAQAEALDKILKENRLEMDRVVVLEVDDEEVVSRIAERWICSQCGQVYHAKNRPPKVPGRCDVCGGALEHRSDDDEATIRERLRVYHETMPSVIDYYDRHGLLRRVAAAGNIDDVQAAVLCALNQGGSRC